MDKKIYNKLVRDRIPEIIESEGKICIYETMTNEKYIEMLESKLSEELAEYQADKNIEEMADLYEVILATIKARGWTMEQLESIRTEKAYKRGSFEKKILLKEVIEK